MSWFRVPKREIFAEKYPFVIAAGFVKTLEACPPILYIAAIRNSSEFLCRDGQFAKTINLFEFFEVQSQKLRIEETGHLREHYRPGSRNAPDLH
jgi:hypothetical protein